MAKTLQFPVFCLGLGLGLIPAMAANITWTGLNADWVEGTGNNANWSPADEPDTDDTAIFNTANSVSLGSNNTILALTMSAGMDLRTNGFDLDVNGLVQLTGSSTNLIVGDAASLLSADSITINNLANLEIEGGTVQVNEESGNGLLDINTGGRLVGNGTVSMTDAVAAGTTVIINEGTISAHRDALILGAPLAATLFINATDVDARIDLDGAAEAGAVTVERNQTLDINLPLADVFNGSVSMVQNTTLDISSAWILGAGATINIDNGLTGGLPSIPAGGATIAGATFSQNSGTITVVDADGTLQFNAPFTMNGGTLTNNGLVEFNASTTITVAANFTMPTATSSLTVAAGRTVNINQANFNLDGANAATNVITVNSDATLNVNTGDYDTDSAPNAFDGTVNLTNGTININTGDAEFIMDGVLNSSASGSDQSLWTGEELDIGNDAGVLDAMVNITGTQPTQFAAQVDFNSDADMNVADGATAHFLALVNFNSVNGGNNARFTGSGELIFSAGVNFTQATTLNMVGGTVDLDGADSIGDTINIDSPLTINAELMRSFGKNNSGGGTNFLDINHSVTPGSLTVNLDAADARWTLNAQGLMRLANGSTEATLLAGSDININGTVNVTGDVRTTARIDFGSTAVVNINTAGRPFRLAGGGNETDTNTISGGTINGVGLLGADAAKSLRGFGTINTGVDFDGNAKLQADNGTLVINGTIVDVDQIGTADVDGALQVTNAWNNSVSTGVQLRGGALSGGTITNDVAAGISGFGAVTARVINNTQLYASLGDVLIFQTVGNNDWDGTTNAGRITAVQANIELRDTATFGFTGTVSANNGHRAFMNGFALDFNPGSTLSLANAGIYEATASTDLGGTVTIGAGGATIKVANNVFLTFETGSTTTLGSDLTLKNNNIIIEAGATFSGTGALILPLGSNMVLEANANANVLLVNQGAVRPGNFDGVGRVDVRDYQQTSTGTLISEITGVNLNQYDRVVVNGTAQVAGELQLDIDGGFVPVAGQSFDILVATGGVTGHFNQIQFFGLPAGVTFQVTYGATFVRATVVAGTQYDLWIQSFPALTNPADRLKTADPDKDGVPNVMEFAFASDPTKPTSRGALFPKIASVNGTPAFTLTFPTRFPGATLGIAPPKVVDTENVYNAIVEAGDTPGLFNANPVLVPPADAAVIHSSLPPLPDGWVYISFRSPTALAGDPDEFIRLRFTP